MLGYYATKKFKPSTKVLPKTIFCSCKDHRLCLDWTCLSLATENNSSMHNNESPGQIHKCRGCRVQNCSSHTKPKQTQIQSKFQQKQDRSRITANLIKCKWINFKATPSKNVSHLGVLYWQLKLNRMWNHCHSTPASCVLSKQCLDQMSRM